MCHFPSGKVNVVSRLSHPCFRILGMYPDTTVATALALARAGHSQAAIARELGTSRATVRDWLRGGQSLLDRRVERRRAHLCDGDCVDHGSLEPTSYTYLLGQYLGDGCISAVKQSSGSA